MNQEKSIYIVDLIYKKKDISLKNLQGVVCVSMSPYADYLLDKAGVSYSHFHNEVVDENDYKAEIYTLYDKLEKSFSSFRQYSFLLYPLCSLICSKVYISRFHGFLNKYFLEGYKAIFLSDQTFESISEKYMLSEVGENVHYEYVRSKDSFFYMMSTLRYYHKLMTWKRIKGSVISRLLFILKERFYALPHKWKYDSDGICRHFSSRKLKSGFDNNNFCNYRDFLFFQETIKESLADIFCSSKLLVRANEIVEKLEEIIKIDEPRPYRVLNFLSNFCDYADYIYYKRSGFPAVFLQHGSYVVENRFLKHCEIYPADVNLTFNRHAKDLFESYGKESVYVFGRGRREIVVPTKKYDYTYIIYCSNYKNMVGSLSVNGELSSENYHEIFNRHVEVIRLFGEKLKNFNLCIKVLPSVFLGGPYVPLYEVSKCYPNVTIEAYEGMDKVLMKSKNIISDYYSSALVDMNDFPGKIMIFDPCPLPIPSEHIDKLAKFVNFVSDVADLYMALSSGEGDNTTVDKRELHIIKKYYMSNEFRYLSSLDDEIFDD